MGTLNLNVEDAMIVIRDGALIYRDTFANFEMDAGRQIPTIPQGIVAVRYSQADGLIIVSTGDTQGEVKSSTVKAGFDWAIGAIDSLLAAQAARTPAPNQPPPDSWAARFIALEASVAALQTQLAAVAARVSALETAP
jgi:hypothetical protein